jgi:hypothetical protein
MAEELSLAYTEEELWRAARISRSLYYKLQKAGRGPRVTRFGARKVILRESAEEWLRAQEAQSQEAPAEVLRS